MKCPNCGKEGAYIRGGRHGRLKEAVCRMCGCVERVDEVEIIKREIKQEKGG